MVVVNSSSPTAACSGPWETRGIEESVTTVDGNAESLYMQGTGREAGLDSLRLPGQGSEGTASSQEPGFSGCCLQPSPHPKPPSSMVSGPRSISRSKSGLHEDPQADSPKNEGSGPGYVVLPVPILQGPAAAWLF